MRPEHGRLHRLLIMANLERLSCWFRHEPWFERCIFSLSANLNYYNQIPHIILATDTQMVIFKKPMKTKETCVLRSCHQPSLAPWRTHKPRKPQELRRGADWGLSRSAHSCYFLETRTLCLRLFQRTVKSPLLDCQLKAKLPRVADLCPILRKKKGLKTG